MAATIKSSVRLFGGVLQRLTHTSKACKCDMTFAVYMPPQAEAKKVPVLYWLSGLTCTDENFSQKSGFARAAAERGVAVVIPDTSPRGVTIEGADDSYDFGLEPRFCVDATQAPWSEHYHMYTYVTSELPALVASTFDGKVSASKAISGHSMGGHGAITLALKNPGLRLRVSVSPICHPTNCPGEPKPSRATLAASRQAKRTTPLCSSRSTPALPSSCSSIRFGRQLLVGDVNQLQLDALQAACLASKGTVELTYRLQGGYDHSYYFISSFIADHIHYHADAMGA